MPAMALEAAEATPEEPEALEEAEPEAVLLPDTELDVLAAEDDVELAGAVTPNSLLVPKTLLMLLISTATIV
jgi:hypothetical protein